VERLHHRDIKLAASSVDGRGDHHESVVHVDEIGLFASEEFMNIALAAFGVDDVFDQEQLARLGELVEFVIAAEVGQHLMAALTEQSGLGSDDYILPAGSLVRIVN
jgi:hypothetical protein